MATTNFCERDKKYIGELIILVGITWGDYLFLLSSTVKKKKKPGHFCSNNEKQIPTLAEKASHTQ